MKRIIVTAAILMHQNEILCMQRGAGKYPYVSYKFEFPGGKVEAGESFEIALSRELQEEMALSVEIKPEQFFMTVVHQYPDFFIEMHSYICPVDHQKFMLREHISSVWLKPQELLSLDWAPADVPIVKRLMEEMGSV